MKKAEEASQEGEELACCEVPVDGRKEDNENNAAAGTVRGCKNSRSKREEDLGRRRREVYDDAQTAEVQREGVRELRKKG